MDSLGAKPDPWRKAAVAAAVLGLLAAIAIAQALDTDDGAARRVARPVDAAAPSPP